jgi:poly-gamma-glutamate synthase PgsB/CapB
VLALKAFFVAGAGAAAFLLFLAAERLLLDARLKRMPVRVGVTGTRGKSSVTRLIAGALRESGTRVLAKTTGSRAILILPDGSEREITRRGLPTVLEQKRVVRLAARLGARALVTEMMSVREECLSAESKLLIRPNILVVTNVRLDHVDLMGETRDEIAACLASAFPRNGIVVVPEEELLPIFAERAAKLGTKLILARKSPASAADRQTGLADILAKNLRLAAEVARVLGVEAAAARRGMSDARPDFGSLRAWDAPDDATETAMTFVNAFAANDPDSTREILPGILDDPGISGRTLLGLLNLRWDRGDRTLQWARAFEEGAFDMLGRIAIIGGQARAFVHRMRRTPAGKNGRYLLLGDKSPERIFRRLAAIADGPALVVGMGNIGGRGAEIVEHWERTGRPHDL